MNDGAILFTISGGPIDAAAPSTTDHSFFFDEADATTIRAALVGDIAGGALLELEIPAGSDASAYEATIVEVADRLYDLGDDLSGYDLTVSPQ